MAQTFGKNTEIVILREEGRGRERAERRESLTSLSIDIGGQRIRLSVEDPGNGEKPVLVVRGERELSILPVASNTFGVRET